MSARTDKLVDLFVEKLRAAEVSVQRADNAARLGEIEAKLPKRFPASFGSLLARYSFDAFDLGGIYWFACNSDASAYFNAASAVEGSLSEVLLPAGYVQIGQPEGGSFDAVCFDMNERKQNLEFRIVQIDHEEILIHRRIKIRRALWESFYKLVEHQLSLP